VAFRPDGRVFATAGRSQPLRIFDRNSNRPIRELVISYFEHYFNPAG
jgi:WD40 repeat protein